MSNIIKKILSFGPGIFAIGYTIGTGSVTSMIVAGSTYGMQLLWVLLLSCLFSGALIYAYGNYYLTTGETALFSFKNRLKYGRYIALLIIIGVTFGQWNSLIGILGISSNILYELVALYIPSAAAHKYYVVLGIAVLVIGTMYRIMLSAAIRCLKKYWCFLSPHGAVLLIAVFRPSAAKRGYSRAGADHSTSGRRAHDGGGFCRYNNGGGNISVTAAFCAGQGLG